jgi:DNA mismatch repair protein MutL
MSDIIHLLPDNIANQIAAGEVIQRPSSVVKELIENSIDAGASSIKVYIKDAGRTLIQVIDDGKGMSETDARMAFERHATSKIKTADDLFSLKTMGFRGEALASIAAVAQVELRTRRNVDELGVKLSISASSLTDIEPVACVEGSVFSVKNLFFNVPARRKFLKSNETEFRNIITEFERIALVNPEISMLLYHDGVEIFNLPSVVLRQRIIDVYGKSLNQKLISLDVDSSLIKITGFVGSPDAVKKRGALQCFFVNGRFMKHPYFHKALMQAYDQLILAGEMPNYFLYFSLDPSAIDVNVHPTKTEIKFENEQQIWQIIVATAREALAKSFAIPSIDFNMEDAIDIPVYSSERKQQSLSAPTIGVNSAYNPFSSALRKKPEFDWTELYQGFEEGKDSIEPQMFPEEKIPSLSFSNDSGVKDEREIAPCYQYKNRYIVTSLKSGLIIVDQHRAHIRVLFDKYLDIIRARKGVSQQVLFPEIIELTTSEVIMLPDIIDEMQYVGFDLANLGNNTYAINGIPADLSGISPADLVRELINKAMEIKSSVKEEIAKILALSLSKISAIPSGKVLSIEEMEHLIASLFSCQESMLSPEGNNILYVIKDEELDKRFK